MINALSALRLKYASQAEKSVATLARAIATEMKFPQAHIDTISGAARIHDIGELALPAELLLKPEKLTSDEYTKVRRHCQIGYDMVKDLDHPWPFRETILQHHERLDGSGYPAGLKGSEICLGALVVGAADVIAAICSDRPYKRGSSLEAALQEMQANRGTLYDDGVVDAFDKLCSKKSIEFPR